MIEARTGEPSREILNYIDENEVDLTVIASHGRTGLDRMLIGSVAERVVRQSPTPVFVAKPDRAALVSSDAAEAASARD